MPAEQQSERKHTTIRQGIFDGIIFHGSPKIAKICNFCRINFCG